MPPPADEPQAADPSLFGRLNRLMDGVQAALVGADADGLVLACRTLAEGLSAAGAAVASGGANRPADQRLDALQASLIEQRLKALRQLIQQQGAATDRALAVLFPQQSAVYSGKSAFGGAGRLGPGKSYQA